MIHPPTPPKECPRCHEQKTVKDGSYRGNPRRLCRVCHFRYSGNPAAKIPSEVKRAAVYLYLEGMTLSAIASTLRCSKVSVMRWINQAKEDLDSLRRMVGKENDSPVIMATTDKDTPINSERNSNFTFGLMITEHE